MKTKRNDKKKGEGIASLIELSYLLLGERSFVDFWFNEDIQNLSFHIYFIPLSLFFSNPKVFLKFPKVVTPINSGLCSFS